MSAVLGGTVPATYVCTMRAFLIALAIALMLPAMAFAKQGDERLDSLFERLQAAHDAVEVKVLEAAIWQIWLQSGSDSVDLLMQDGTLAMSQGDYRKALEAFDAIVQVEPDFAEGWNKRATLYYVMGNYQASIADIQKTLALEPRHFGALSGLGQILDRLEDAKGALAAYSRALAADPHLDDVRERVKQLTLKVKGSPI
ncbi:MAG TPA: tetratricopeptide repeat protein [Candidatus Cybelea sp.]|nr:tetratricopeptide repeat protein [Candidatus Cybelea sp.]